MGICFEERKKERQDRNTKKAKSLTRGAIMRIEIEINNLENEIKSMIQNLNMLKNTPGVSNAKIEDLKRDIMSKIKTYKKCLIQRRTLKNNLDNIENKERENAIAKQLGKNNEVLGINDNNDEIFQKNNEFNQEQKNNQEMNDNILKEGDHMFIGIDQLKMDGEIENFLNGVI